MDHTVIFTDREYEVFTHIMGNCLCDRINMLDLSVQDDYPMYLNNDLKKLFKQKKNLKRFKGCKTVDKFVFELAAETIELGYLHAKIVGCRTKIIDDFAQRMGISVKLEKSPAVVCEEKIEEGEFGKTKTVTVSLGKNCKRKSKPEALC
jgi:hypothetical protein